jgi:hypothetical protein
MKDKLKTIVIILSGFLTFVLEPFIPMEGGGASMIIFLTIPFLIGLGIILSLVYYFYYVRKNKLNKPIAFAIMLSLMILLNFLFYPYG